MEKFNVEIKEVEVYRNCDNDLVAEFHVNLKLGDKIVVEDIWMDEKNYGYVEWDPEHYAEYKDIDTDDFSLEDWENIWNSREYEEWCNEMDEEYVYAMMEDKEIFTAKEILKRLRDGEGYDGEVWNFIDFFVEAA